MAVFETHLVVIAHDVIERGFVDIALDVGEVVKTFVAFGGGGGFVFGERHGDFGGHESCIFHDALGFAGMHPFAVDFECSACGVEVLVSDVAFVASIDRVGVFSLEIA